VQYLVSIHPKLSRKINKLTVIHFSDKNKKVFSETKNLL